MIGTGAAAEVAPFIAFVTPMSSQGNEEGIIYPITRALTGATAPGQSRPGSNGN